MENIIIKNILNKDQIDHIYSVVNSTSEKNTKIQQRLGHKAYLVSLGEEIRKHFEEVVQKYYGDEWILTNYQFARYSTKFGYKPKLYPHFDTAFDVHKLTLDVQISSTVDWPLVVEGKEFLLKDNEGLIFSGTDQIHWRSDLDLSENDVVDLVFCHCERKDGPNRTISKEHKKNMEVREKQWQDKVLISKEVEFSNIENGV
jgi:hypothetical protein